MGRPLAKRFFGNRNIGSGSTTADNSIGGEGLATIATPGTQGSILVCSTATSVPVLTIPAPTLPGGVQATGQVTWEVESVVVTNGLSGHSYTITTGTTVLTGLGGGATFSITAVGSGQGEVQTIVPVNRGSFTTIPVVADTYQIVGGDGNQQAHVYYRVKTIAVTEKGSGYTSAPTITFVNTGVKGTGPGSTTSVLTTDSGATNNQGNAVTNQENAIIAYAKTTTGGTRKIADIQQQKGSHRYKVKTSDGVAVCLLRTDGGTGVNTCDITAYDSDGGEYWVKKLTSRRAVLVVKGTNGGSQFATGASVKWVFRTLTSGDEGNTVKIDNA